MKPILEYLPLNFGESFVTKFFDFEFYSTPWHFHPEYELVLVVDSTGKKFIGDNISDFKPGDLVLLGPYLPHVYKNDTPYLQGNKNLRAKSIVVHFKDDALGIDLMRLPEAHRISSLLNRSDKGLSISGHTNKIVTEILYELVKATGFDRIMLLLKILDLLSNSNELTYICNNLIIGQNNADVVRLNKVINFVIGNFQAEISLSEAADLINMAENSFSRYFSQRTRKSFTGFVNEVRLNNASKMLIETNKSVTEISMACGFNNLSNFNRQFRKLYGQNPLNFRRLYLSPNYQTATELGYATLPL